jgi:predicted transcriptional regulator
MMNGKRSDFEITAAILHVARNGAKKSRIVSEVKLNYKNCKEYLDHLMNSGLIVGHDNGKRVYLTTDKGREYIKHFEYLKELRGKTSRLLRS